MNAGPCLAGSPTVPQLPGKESLRRKLLGPGGKQMLGGVVEMPKKR